jgi:hypothetical protein
MDRKFDFSVRRCVEYTELDIYGCIYYNTVFVQLKYISMASSGMRP